MVGLTPELLPAIISISLSRGAQEMAKARVIVRRLNAIENLGSVDILCTDKTGTVTLGTVNLDKAMDANGQPSQAVLTYAGLNAGFQSGMKNALDEAIVNRAGKLAEGFEKLDEVPYDFIRKRLSVVVEGPDGQATLVCKGALDKVLAVCSAVSSQDGITALDEGALQNIHALFEDWSAQGFRVLGLAVKPVEKQGLYTVDKDEQNLSFLGFLLFMDPPKADARQTIEELNGLGVKVKIITGDNHLMARYIAAQLGLDRDSVLNAKDMARMSPDALAQVAERTAIFAEVDPAQKEQIILALRKRGHVVGYMGDGINDAPALHMVDVGISVETAAEVAKKLFFRKFTD